MAQSVQAVPSFIERRPYGVRSLAWPTQREWVRHGLLFAITILTTTFAGVMLLSPAPTGFSVADPHSLVQYLTYVPRVYATEVVGLTVQAIRFPSLLTQGLTFSASLLAILTAHEFGHYFACRRYRVNATLPFFLPAPPLMLTGTFGAFIKIKAPIPSRRALFDIGVAGPIAGFVVALPIAVIGLLLSHPAAQTVAAPGETSIIFHDPLLFRALARLTGKDLSALAGNAWFYASWIGLLVTSLNLMPVGQLDGGHASYAVLGKTVHRLLSRLAFGTMSLVAIAGYAWHGSPSGFVYALLLLVVLRMPHPDPIDDTTTLDGKRQLVAVFTLLIFALSFLPFPISVQ